MRLSYKNKEITVTTTSNKQIMRYKFPKLYYAIVINNCNRYSSIASKQRVDVVMVDDKLTILSIKKDMHENTVFENKKATKTIILPLNYYDNLEINTKFDIITQKRGSDTFATKDKTK